MTPSISSKEGIAELPFLVGLVDSASLRFLILSVGVNRVTYTNWENGKREPELDKVVELATELNSTVDYLLGNSDINYLYITENELKNLSTEEAKNLSDEMKKNLFTIFEVGKDKFDMTNEELEIMKILIIKK